MKFPKLHLPKIKLTTILRIALAVVILLEVFILYKAFYLDAKKRTAVESAIERSPVEIDRQGADRARNWFLLREIFTTPPEYDLAGPEMGRDNPFAQY